MYTRESGVLTLGQRGYRVILFFLEQKSLKLFQSQTVAGYNA